MSSVSDEIYRWQKNFINVESLKRQHDEVNREAKSLREKVAMLEKKIHVSITIIHCKTTKIIDLDFYLLSTASTRRETCYFFNK